MVKVIRRRKGVRQTVSKGGMTNAHGPGSGRSSSNSKKNRKVWYSLFSSEYWQAKADGGNGGTGFWDGSKWVANEYLSSNNFQVDLEPKGGWEVGFRPNRIRITQSTFVSNMALKDSDTPENDIAVSASPPAITESVIEFEGFDIATLFEQKVGSGFNITNIQFRSDVAPAAPTTTTTTTTV